MALISEQKKATSGFDQQKLTDLSHGIGKFVHIVFLVIRIARNSAVAQSFLSSACVILPMPHRE
jgi:hypothetical protein